MRDELYNIIPHTSSLIVLKFGAGNEIRTRDFDLGKVALYH